MGNRGFHEGEVSGVICIGNELRGRNILFKGIGCKTPLELRLTITLLRGCVMCCVIKLLGNYVRRKYVGWLVYMG